MTNIETPDGWERMGHRFVRAYGHDLAVMGQDYTDGTWLPWIHTGVNSVFQGKWLPLPDAVAWANDQLGVPTPVEVVEREFADGSVLLWSEDGARSARVELVTGDWQHGIAGGWAFNGTTYKFKPTAIQAASAYVRGAS